MGKLGAATPLELAQRIGSLVVVGLLGTGRFRTVLVCGSVRRNVSVVSDVDVLLELENRWEPDLTTVPGLPEWHWTPKGGVAQIEGVRVELYLSPSDCVGATAQFLTGPGDLNVYLRRKAQHQGWKLSQYGLVGSHGRIDDPGGSLEEQERSIFDALGVPYMTPEERSIWRDVVRGAR